MCFQELAEIHMPKTMSMQEAKEIKKRARKKMKKHYQKLKIKLEKQKLEQKLADYEDKLTTLSSLITQEEFEEHYSIRFKN